jgi:hypothetical protein
MRYFVKCPYCKTKNEIKLKDIADDKVYLVCNGCLECFKIEVKLKGVCVDFN